MFRKYMSELGDFYNIQHGIVISDEILLHLAWAGYLIQVEW